MAHTSKRSRSPGEINCTESAEDILKRIVPHGHRGLMMMKCPFCSYSKHIHPTLFGSHLRIHTGEKPYKCEVCNKGFAKKWNLKSHHEYYHSNQKNLNVHLTDKNAPQFAVSVKSISTTSENLRIQKEDILHPSPEPMSPQESEITTVDLKLDNGSVNGNEHSRISPQCFICFKKFCSLKELHGHLTVHTVEKPYRCNVCEFGFLKCEAFKNHSIIHSEENSKSIDLQPIPKEKAKEDKIEELTSEGEFKNKMVTNTEPTKLSNEPTHKACTCKYCKTGFIQESALKLHKKIHLDKNRRWGCNHCQESFDSHDELKSHYRLSHRYDKHWICQECKKRFKSTALLVRHLYIHTGEKHFKCNVCDKGFNQKTILRAHAVSHTGERAFMCNICNKLFSQKRSVEVHKLSHIGQKLFRCTICSVGFKYRRGLRLHEKSHTDEKQTTLQPKVTRIDLQTKSSEKEQKIEDTLADNSETQVVHADSNSGYNQTNTLFTPTIKTIDSTMESSTDSDIKHLQCEEKLKHNFYTNTATVVPPIESNNLITEDKPFKCNTCNKGFNLKCNVRVHERLHTGEKPFKCNICQRKFNQKSNLKAHECFHSGERSFKSNISNDGHCTKQKLDDQGFEKKVKNSIAPAMKIIDEASSVVSKSFLCKFCMVGYIEPTTSELHSKTHTDKKPWICNDCRKSFPERTQLSSHLRITHRGKKRWLCQVCQKRFNHSTKLSHHLFIHTGEKPFKCNFCNKRCTQKGGLAVHLRIHTGEKPFKCEICDKAFNQKISLIAHGRSHTGETPFKCNSCVKDFKHRKDLKNHMLSHTKDKHFTCNICNKRFNMEHNLKVHLKSHTREKQTRLNLQPEIVSLDLETQMNGEQNQMDKLQYNTKTEILFVPEKQVNSPPLEVSVISISHKTITKSSVCKYCKTGFVNISPSSHVHTGKNHWICNHCQQSFARETILKYHYRKFHLGEKHCICEECKKRFKFKSELNNHLLEHTGKKPDQFTTDNKTFDSESDTRASNSILGAGLKYSQLKTPGCCPSTKPKIEMCAIENNCERTVMKLGENTLNVTDSDIVKQISDSNNTTTSLELNPEERARQWSSFLKLFKVKIAN